MGVCGFVMMAAFLDPSIFMVESRKRDTSSIIPHHQAIRPDSRRLTQRSPGRMPIKRPAQFRTVLYAESFPSVPQLMHLQPDYGIPLVERAVGVVNATTKPKCPNVLTCNSAHHKHE